jgi:DNA end-binding protein Ku
MAARSIGSGTVSFGLVAIPVRLYVATHSESVSFNMLHEPCGTRVKQQLYCPTHETVVPRSEIVKGYEVQKDHYVTFTADELKALEAETNRSIDIEEFVPLAKVDPIFFENAHYLGPDKGGEKAYHLLVEAMLESGRVAVAQYASHGKEHIVLIRPIEDALVMHVLYYADEVRGTSEIGIAVPPKIRPNEKGLARKLIDELSTDEFRPEKYQDQYRDRVKAVVAQKVAGEEVTVAESAEPQAQVIDLMQALKESLGRRRPRGAEKASQASGKREAVGSDRRQAASRRRARKG